MAKRRRTRTAHPGVKEHKRARRDVTTYYARFIDSDTGRERDENMTALGLTTAEARREWMIRKSRALAERRAALATGAPRHTRGSLAEALTSFVATQSNAATARTYREGVERFRGWADRQGLRSTDDVHAHHLAQFREWLRTAPRQVAAKGKGAGAGARVVGAEPAKATSVNCRLRSLKACLNWLRKQGRLPHVDAEAVRERLAALRADEDPPRFLRPEEVRSLLDACRRHDAAVFDLTREEHDRLRAPGSTPRYTPITTFVLAGLLGGFREGELRRLTWPMIDLDARDEHGQVVGEIRLPGAGTKTRRARIVDLGISPGLRLALVAWRLRTGGTGYVFGGEKPWPRTLVEAARKRLTAQPKPDGEEKSNALRFGAPAFTWQDLRSTCATYHVNMAGLGSAAAWQAALRLGHSVTVAQRFYVGLLRGIPREARSLEAAMGIETSAQSVRPEVATA